MKSDPFAVYGDGGKRIAIPAFKCQLRQLICNSCCVITPAANRNAYRVAKLVEALTQGSGLRPQPWAVKSQLCQSCCCLRIAYNNSPRCFCLRFPAYNNSPCCFCLLGHAPFSLYLFTINTWIGGEIGTAIIIIMIYYKKTAHHFAQIEIKAIFAHHHLYLCHNH